MHPRRAKDSKTIGFGGVLWVLSAAVGRKCPAGGNNRGMRIATASVRTGFAMTPFARGVNTPPYGCVARNAVKRGVGDAAPYAPFIDRIP